MPAISGFYKSYPLKYRICGMFELPVIFRSDEPSSTVPATPPDDGRPFFSSCLQSIEPRSVIKVICFFPSNLRCCARKIAVGRKIVFYFLSQYRTFFYFLPLPKIKLFKQENYLFYHPPKAKKRIPLSVRLTRFFF